MKIHIEDNMCTVYKLMLHRMQNILLDNGYELAADLNDADLCLAGVCAAFTADEQRSAGIVERLRGAGRPLYAYGCMTKVNPEKIATPLQFASWRADDLLRELLDGNAIFPQRQSLPATFRRRSDYRVYNPRKKFIGISTGCSFECSYCPHRKGAGSIRSIPSPDIMDMLREFDAATTETIVLTGIDTACYGLEIGTSFYALLKELLGALGKGINVHIAQFNPEGLFITPDYPDMMLELWSDARIKDIQLPIQTGSRRLLSLMNRNYCPDTLDHFLSSLKKTNPAVMLRTDLLIGFPTETVQELEESIEFVVRHYSEVALYIFEMKKETPIYSMGLPSIPPEEAERRRRYAAERIGASDILVHSGAQKIETLMQNDVRKEASRR